MKKLLILGLVLCFTTAASASTVHIACIVGEGDDADPLTSFIKIYVNVTGGGGVVGLDIGIKDPDGIPGGVPVCWTDDVIYGGVGVDTDFEYYHQMPVTEYDDREGFVNAMFNAFVEDDGVIAYSGANPPYTYDIPQPDPFFLEPNAYLSGGIAPPGSSSIVTGFIGRVGCDGMGAEALRAALQAMGDPNIPPHGGVFIGPGGIAIDAGYTIDVINITFRGLSANCLYDIPSDFNGDCYANWEDFAIFASYWLEDCSAPDFCEGTDMDQSGLVDWGDFAIFASYWLWCSDPENPDCWSTWLL